VAVDGSLSSPSVKMYGRRSHYFLKEYQLQDGSTLNEDGSALSDHGSALKSENVPRALYVESLKKYRTDRHYHKTDHNYPSTDRHYRFKEWQVLPR